MLTVCIYHFYRISHGSIRKSHTDISIINSTTNYFSGKGFSVSADRHRGDQYDTEVVVYDFGMQLTYECETGYVFRHETENSELHITCEENGVWKGHVTDCIIIECPAPLALKHGRITLKTNHNVAANERRQNASNLSNDGSLYVYGSEIEASCDIGYKLAGPSIRECLKNGKWSSPEPHCEWVTCDLSTLGLYSEPPTPITENGELNISGNFYDALAEFICRPGFRLTLPLFNSSWSLTKLTWTCQLSGSWVLFNSTYAGSELMDAILKRGQALCKPSQYTCPEPKVRFHDSHLY
jgi:hypothetical protein